MKLPKRYGQSKIEKCPFCNEQALSMNKQGIPTCTDHKDQYLDAKCICGEHLDILQGKYGVFFKCFNCGTKTLKKVLEMKALMDN